jgi:hypothetical protein
MLKNIIDVQYLCLLSLNLKVPVPATYLCGEGQLEVMKGFFLKAVNESLMELVLIICTSSGCVMDLKFIFYPDPSCMPKVLEPVSDLT